MPGLMAVDNEMQKSLGLAGAKRQRLWKHRAQAMEAPGGFHREGRMEDHILDA